MAEPQATFRSPYTPTPGSSTPSPDVTPREGIAEFWAFFWLAVATTVIIAATGIATWLFVH